MSKKLEVRCDGQFAYHILIEQDFWGLKDAVLALKTEGRRALIVTDSNVAPLYLDEVKRILQQAFCAVSAHVLPAGEAHKNTAGIETIYNACIQAALDRNDYLVALGGGVVGDMTGFAAATYMRGIRFIQVPTTLLSQVDSSIGGKTGVDFGSYKNMVGAFHMPALVYTNIGTLLSLDAEQYASGMGEVIKHALIKSRSYFDMLCANEEKIVARDLLTLEEVVYESNLIKRAVVEEDPKEHGARALLNFGHTLGHAIERCSDFSLSHGQCVALGCLCALRLSEATTKEENAAVEKLMARSGLSLKLTLPLRADEILAATKKDKKMDKGKVKFIRLRALGDACIDMNVTDEMMRDALLAVMQP